MDNNTGSTTDSSKPSVNICTVVIVLLIDVALIYIWWKLVFSYSSDPYPIILNGIPSMLGSLVAFSAIVFGINVVNKGILNRGGTVFYTKKYGYKELNSILSDYDNYSDYENVKKTIKELIIRRSPIEFDSPYFDCVYELQGKDDENFKKVWNDYNYYFNKKPMLKSEERYLKRLEKYVFIKVYETYKSK